MAGIADTVETPPNPLKQMASIGRKHSASTPHRSSPRLRYNSGSGSVTSPDNLSATPRRKAMNPEEIAMGIRQTTADIQNLSINR